MSNRIHHCPNCDKEWYCEGCEVSETETLCWKCEDEEMNSRKHIEIPAGKKVKIRKIIKV